jgi:hypothetical protein
LMEAFGGVIDCWFWIEELQRIDSRGESGELCGTAFNFELNCPNVIYCNRLP